MYTSLEGIFKEETGNYVYYVHGIKSSSDTKHIVEQIFEQGLKIKGELHFTVVPLGKYSSDIVSKIKNYTYEGSNKILIFKIPVNLLNNEVMYNVRNIMGMSEELLLKKNNIYDEDENIIGYFPTNYLVGCYDKSVDKVLINSNYKEVDQTEKSRIINNVYNLQLERKGTMRPFPKEYSIEELNKIFGLININQNNIHEILPLYDNLMLKYCSNGVELIEVLYNYIRDNRYEEDEKYYIDVNGKKYLTDDLMYKLIKMCNYNIVNNENYYILNCTWGDEDVTIFISNKGIKTNNIELQEYFKYTFSNKNIGK